MKRKQRNPTTNFHQSFPSMDTPSPSISLKQFDYAWDIQAYLRFANIQFTEYNTEYPSVEITGRLPQLSHGNRSIGNKKILPYIREHIRDLDAQFDQSVRQEIAVYTYMIENYANTVYDYLMWSKKLRNYAALSALYGSIIPFPASLKHYWNEASRVQKCVNLTIPEGDKAKIDLVINIYRILNEKLHVNREAASDDSFQFLYGSTPSSLDAVFFGHIARIMCYSARLRNHLFNYPNLVDYYDGIMKRYFAPSLGIPTSENALIRAYGMHIACVAPADPIKILPYANEDIRNRVEEEEEIWSETTQVKAETTSVEEKLEMRKSILQFVIGGVSALSLIILMQMGV